MVLKGNETHCGLFGIPIVVMAGSHSSVVHLDSNIMNGDDVTLSSLAHHNISYKGEEYSDDKRKIKLSPQEVTSCHFPRLNINDSCERICESYKSGIYIQAQDISMGAMPIMKED